MTTTLTDRLTGSSSIGSGTDLDAIEAVQGTGILCRTAENTWSARTLTAPAAGITVTFGTGASGNPTLALANDLSGLEGLASTGFAVRSATDTWVQRSIAISGAGLSVANGSGVGGDPTISLVAATQAEQETGSLLTVMVTPGRQQFHASACKFWAQVTVSGGTPTLGVSYNVTSITDTGTGLLTITIGTDFSSANWHCGVSVERAATTLTVANLRAAAVRNAGMAAGTILVECWDGTAVTANQVDPATWHVRGFGDQ